MERIRKQGFAYSFDPAACASCAGRCCRGESGNIWVTGGEIDRMVAFLGSNRIDFVASSLRRTDNRLSLRERRIGQEVVCLFFDFQTRRCQIYPVRPAQCREFPFWVHFRNCPEELVRECPGIRLSAGHPLAGAQFEQNRKLSVARLNVSGETEKEILAILEEAIRREQAAHALYSRGEALAGKEELRRIFAMLAREEMAHEKLLQEIYYEHKKRLGLQVLRLDEDHDFPATD